MELLHWLGSNMDFPGLIMLIVFMMGVWVVYRVQKENETFDFADMLRDESGKPSSGRMFGFIAVAASTWALMYMLIHGSGVIDKWLYLGYMGVWSGSKAVDRVIDAYFKKQGPPPGS